MLYIYIIVYNDHIIDYKSKETLSSWLNKITANFFAYCIQKRTIVWDILELCTYIGASLLRIKEIGKSESQCRLYSYCKVMFEKVILQYDKGRSNSTIWRTYEEPPVSLITSSPNLITASQVIIWVHVWVAYPLGGSKGREEVGTKPSLFKQLWRHLQSIP